LGWFQLWLGAASYQVKLLCCKKVVIGCLYGKICQSCDCKTTYRSFGAVMQNEWLYIGLFLVIGVIVPIVPLIFARLVAPRKPNAIKLSTYECGIETVGESWVQFKAQYYIFALVFLVFDVETVFLFPWALTLKQLPLFVVLEGILFIGILVAGLVYVWRKGMLEWA
jgi:NADH:ubiquinone oxidoreductase subunit 3 (subunit A)